VIDCPRVGDVAEPVAVEVPAVLLGEEGTKRGTPPAIPRRLRCDPGSTVLRKTLRSASNLPAVMALMRYRSVPHDV
jgi:hypothetical protein